MDLGDRMKTYERVPDVFLTRRTPVILRIDGKAFHTFTRGLGAFDDRLGEAMQITAYHLVANIDGAQLAYTQSDEISILLVDYKKLNTEAWFANRVQKMCSVAASMATGYFNCTYKSSHLAFFDCRAYNVPKEDVCNYFIWRQRDATKNSVSSLASEYFSHKELQGVNHNERQNMLFSGHGVNWNDLDTWKKRGICAASTVDREIPIFSEDREYIERYVNV